MWVVMMCPRGLGLVIDRGAARTKSGGFGLGLNNKVLVLGLDLGSKFLTLVLG